MKYRIKQLRQDAFIPQVRKNLFFWYSISPSDVKNIFHGEPRVSFIPTLEEAENVILRHRKYVKEKNKYPNYIKPVEEDYSPYCKICESCGQDACCSPIHCEQKADGMYCNSYLKTLKLHYQLCEYVEKVILPVSTEDVIKDFYREYDRLYEIYIHGK